MVREHLLRLQPDERRRRFFGCVGDAEIADYADGIFAAGAIVLGCFVGGTLRAIGELHPMERRGRLAEVAVTVERPFQSRGIGTELLRRIVELAGNRLVGTLHLSCLIDNVPVQRIARHLGGALHQNDGLVEAEINPPWPSYGSLLGEALADGSAAIYRWWGETGPELPMRRARAMPPPSWPAPRA